MGVLDRHHGCVVGFCRLKEKEMKEYFITWYTVSVVAAITLMVYGEMIYLYLMCAHFIAEGFVLFMGRLLKRQAQ
jgi:hypothetical protein